MGDLLYCSFCGKNQNEVSKLIAGPKVFICEECTELCMDIIRSPEKSFKLAGGGVTPGEIQAALRESPSGYARAKAIASLALYEQIKRDAKASGEIGALPGNGHILLIGPVGCGKRLLAQRLAVLRGGPFAMSHGALLSAFDTAEQAWQDLFGELLRRADNVGELANRGTVYVEGVDDALAEARSVQQFDRLHQCLQGRPLEFDAHSMNLGGKPSKVVWDTSETLFILGGAFVGLPDQSGPIAPKEAERLGRAVGLIEARKRAAALQSVSRIVVVDYGLDEKLIDRLPYVAVLRDLRDGEVAAV